LLLNLRLLATAGKDGIDRIALARLRGKAANAWRLAGEPHRWVLGPLNLAGRDIRDLITASF